MYRLRLTDCCVSVELETPQRSFRYVSPTFLKDHVISAAFQLTFGTDTFRFPKCIGSQCLKHSCVSAEVELYLVDICS